MRSWSRRPAAVPVQVGTFSLRGQSRHYAICYVPGCTWALSVAFPERDSAEAAWDVFTAPYVKAKRQLQAEVEAHRASHDDDEGGRA